MSNENCMEALELANVVRRNRADFKRSLQGAHFIDIATAAADFIREPEWWGETWRVDVFLLALPKFGKSKTTGLLRRSGIPAGTALGSLTPRQSGELADALEFLAAEYRRNRGHRIAA